MIKRSAIFWFFILVLMGGCSIVNADDEVKRTFPEALDYKTVSFGDFENQISPPDSININVYVIAISECPPKNYCFLPDAIVISDSLHPVSQDSQYRLTVYKPSQFKKDTFYQLSLKIGTYPGNGDKSINLAGYSRKKNEIY